MTEHRIDILISRIVDKIETSTEWNEFRTLAASEPSAWELLAEAQRDNERLRALALDATRSAEAIELPQGEPLSRSRFLRRPFSSGLGWAVAAAILLAWVTSGPFAPIGKRSSTPEGVKTASMLNTDAAWDNYLDRSSAEGTLVGEIEPKILLDSKELPDGTLEVTFVRQVVERRTVPALVRPSYDEAGRITPVIVRPGTRRSL